MSLIADGVLIATCLTAAIYCYVLARRLRRLASNEDGIGQRIIELNAALAETRGAVAEIRESSRAASDRLGREIAEARKVTAELKRLVAEGAKLPTHRFDATGEDASWPARGATRGAVPHEAGAEDFAEDPVQDEADDSERSLEELFADKFIDPQLGFGAEADADSAAAGAEKEAADAEADGRDELPEEALPAMSPKKPKRKRAAPRAKKDDVLKVERMTW